MQFPYEDKIVNLLDTPGHADFGEDTYRVLTAVDSALMVIDVAKGVEERTIKLMEVCRLRDTPIMTFINKLDREGKDPIELLDEVETVLGIQCAPVTWPIGMGQRLKGVVHLLTGEVHLYEPGRNFTRQDSTIFPSIDAPGLAEKIGAQMLTDLRDELELVQGASHPFDLEAYRAGKQTPVFFGSGVNNFGVQPLLDFFVEHAPSPQARSTTGREIAPEENKLTGFVFKIQANMDPQHRDRVAFMRVCSGRFSAGMKTFHVRTGKEMKLANALTFMASDREIAAEAWPGDVIGIHNHGTISIGDTFTEGEAVTFTGIPNFAPELFRRAPARSAQAQAAAEGTGPAVRRRRDPVLPPSHQQRPDPGCGGCAAVRRGGLSPEGRVRRGSHLRAGQRDHRALGPLQQREEAGRVPREECAEPGTGCSRPPGLPGTDPGQPAAGAGTLAGRAFLGHPRSGPYRFGRLMPRGRILSGRKGL